jgi:hypothetical protein
MKNIIINAYTIESLLKKIETRIKDGFNPSLAFIYSSSKHNIKKLVIGLEHHSFLVMGATTAGEIFANEELGVHEVDDTIVAMLIEIDPTAIDFRFSSLENEESYFNMGKNIGTWAKSKFKNPALITITSGLNFDNDAYTQGIVYQGVEYIFGGSAGDDMELEETFVFSKDNFSNHGMITLVIDKDKIELVGSRAFGWIGIGKERIVTKAEQNIVYEVDGKPAIDFYKEYLNISPEESVPLIGIEYPLEVVMKSGLVVYRAVLGIDENKKALIFAGHVEEKSKIRISAPQGESIIEHVGKSIDSALELKSSFKPEIGLLFPCCSRKQVLGNLAIKEIELAYERAKVPLIGFYAYGEIGAYSGGYAFHNETFVTALLGEKER